MRIERPHPIDRVGVVLLALAVGACLVPVPAIALAGAAVLVLFLPGRSLIRCLPEIQRLPGRSWLALAASILLVPVVLDWIWRTANDRYLVLAGLTALNAVLLGAGRYVSPPRRPPARMWTSRAAGVAFTLLAGFVAACVFLTFWLPSAGDRFAEAAAHDYIKHHAVLWSLERYPLPLHSPFYAAEQDTPYYYYHFHHLLPAALRKLTGDRVPISLAFGLTSAVLACTVLGLVYLLASRLFRRDGPAWLAAACVSVVGGWDAVVVGLRTLAGAAPVIVLDSWCPVPWRMHNLMTQYVWCPQHVAALTGLLLAVLWLSAAPRARWWVVVAPLLAASALGSSVYLAITFFLAAAAYVLVELGWRVATRRTPAEYAAALIAIAVLGAALMGVQAWQYRAMNARAPGGLTWVWERFDFAALGRILPPGPLANLLDAPWLILVDLGLPALALVLVRGSVWRRVARDDGLRLLLIAAVVGVVALFCVRSRHSPFDYSFRVAILPLQVLAALLAGGLLRAGQVRPWARPLRVPALVIGALLGLPVGLYEAPLMAVRSVLRPSPHAAEAGALLFLREDTPPGAIVQGDPAARVGLVQLIERPLGVADPENSHVRVFYPRDMAAMQESFERAQAALATPDAGWAATALRALRVQYVLLGSDERRIYGALRQFDDERWFAPVYDDGTTRVLRVLDAARSSLAMASEPAEAP